MSTVIVFRVEHPEQQSGPYRYNNEPGEPRYTDYFDDGHLPNTCDDAYDCGMYEAIDKLFRETTIAHCFKDLEHCYNWFDAPRREKLKELGFVLTMYTVAADKVLHLNRQSLFDRYAVVQREVIDWPTEFEVQWYEDKEQKVA